MSEVSKFEAYKKKMQGICDENNLVYRFSCNEHPITLTIKPVKDDTQLRLEPAEETAFTSPDAEIVFAYKEGNLTYRMAKNFSISDALFNKIKNLYKNLYFMWLQFFHREILERGLLKENDLPSISENDDGTGFAGQSNAGNEERTEDESAEDPDDDSEDDQEGDLDGEGYSYEKPDSEGD